MNPGNIKFQPEKRTFSNPFTLKINFVHLENVFKVPFKQILFTLKFGLPCTLLSGETRVNVNKCIFLK